MSHDGDQFIRGPFGDYCVANNLAESMGVEKGFMINRLVPEHLMGKTYMGRMRPGQNTGFMINESHICYNHNQENEGIPDAGPCVWPHVTLQFRADGSFMSTAWDQEDSWVNQCGIFAFVPHRKLFVLLSLDDPNCGVGVSIPSHAFSFGPGNATPPNFECDYFDCCKQGSFWYEVQFGNIYVAEINLQFKMNPDMQLIECLRITIKHLCHEAFPCNDPGIGLVCTHSNVLDCDGGAPEGFPLAGEFFGFGVGAKAPEYSLFNTKTGIPVGWIQIGFCESGTGECPPE